MNIDSRNHKIVLTRQGNSIFVSEVDYENIAARRWCISSTGYPVANLGGKVISMHRYLMAPPKGYQVDHINGNKLDNRRENLRIVNNGANSRNKKRQSDGVTWRGDNHNSWCARFRIKVENSLKSICLGYFKNRGMALFANARYRTMCLSMQLAGMDQNAVFKQLYRFRISERELQKSRGWKAWSVIE